jgi:hypothetical protein
MARLRWELRHYPTTALGHIWTFAGHFRKIPCANWATLRKLLASSEAAEAEDDFSPNRCKSYLLFCCGLELGTDASTVSKLQLKHDLQRASRSRPYKLFATLNEADPGWPKRESAEEREICTSGSMSGV